MRILNESRAAAIAKKHNASRRHYERSARFEGASGVRSVPVRAYSSLRLGGGLALASGPPLPHEIHAVVELLSYMHDKIIACMLYASRVML